MEWGFRHHHERDMHVTIFTKHTCMHAEFVIAATGIRGGISRRSHIARSYINIHIFRPKSRLHSPTEQEECNDGKRTPCLMEYTVWARVCVVNLQNREINNNGEWAKWHARFFSCSFAGHRNETRRRIDVADGCRHESQPQPPLPILQWQYSDIHSVAPICHDTLAMLLQHQMHLEIIQMGRTYNANTIWNWVHRTMLYYSRTSGPSLLMHVLG